MGSTQGAALLDALFVGQALVFVLQPPDHALCECKLLLPFLGQLVDVLLLRLGRRLRLPIAWQRTASTFFSSGLSSSVYFDSGISFPAFSQSSSTISWLTIK
jgi:hypothetical protein